MLPWPSVSVSHPNLFAFLGHLQNTTVDNMSDVARLRNGLQIRRPKLKANLMNEARISSVRLKIRQWRVRHTTVPACCEPRRWRTPRRCSPANMPTVLTTTTTTTTSYRLLSARPPQRRFQRQLLQSHHCGAAKFVCWHLSKALLWCPAYTQDSVRAVRVA